MACQWSPLWQHNVHQQQQRGHVCSTCVWGEDPSRCHHLCLFDRTSCLARSLLSSYQSCEYMCIFYTKSTQGLFYSRQKYLCLYFFRAIFCFLANFVPITLADFLEQIKLTGGLKRYCFLFAGSLLTTSCQSTSHKLRWYIDILYTWKWSTHMSHIHHMLLTLI